MDDIERRLDPNDGEAEDEIGQTKNVVVGSTEVENNLKISWADIRNYLWVDLRVLALLLDERATLVIVD